MRHRDVGRALTDRVRSGMCGEHPQGGPGGRIIQVGVAESERRLRLVVEPCGERRREQQAAASFGVEPERRLLEQSAHHVDQHRGPGRGECFTGPGAVRSGEGGEQSAQQATTGERHLGELIDGADQLGALEQRREAILRDQCPNQAERSQRAPPQR